MAKPSIPEWMTEVSVRAIPRGRHEAARYFTDRSELIATGWLRRQQDLKVTTESPHAWFKRNMYRLLKAYIDEGRQDVLLQAARGSGRNLIGLQKIADNPFKIGLFAMWGNNEGLTRHQQRVFGNQMSYAHLHNVAPEDLGRFIRYAGSAQAIANKLRTGLRERGFGADQT